MKIEATGHDCSVPGVTGRVSDLRPQTSGRTPEYRGEVGGGDPGKCSDQDRQAKFCSDGTVKMYFFPGPPGPKRLDARKSGADVNGPDFVLTPLDLW